VTHPNGRAMLQQMTDPLRDRRAASFSQVTAEYARSRPGYPDRAVTWLAPGTGSQVLELGCGTGALTAALADRGHHVVASDLSRSMLAHVSGRLAVHTVEARAETLPLRAFTLHYVVAAQPFH